MKTYNISVVRADGSYGYATISYSNASTVTVQVTGINSAGSNWRVRGRSSLVDDNVYLSEQGLGTYTFSSSNNKSYIFQIQNWNGDWVNTSNMAEQVENSVFDVVFESGGDSGGGSGGDSSGDEILSSYLWVLADIGTSISVERVHTNAGFINEGSYTGKLTYNTTYKDDRGTWYGYKIFYQDRFIITAEALDGYTINTHSYNGYTFNFEVCDLEYYEYLYGDENVWLYELDDGTEPWIYASAIGHSDGGGSGPNTGGDSGSTISGSGILYFDATNYGQQYAVEYSYNSSTFTIKSVKVKLAQYASVWWAFNLDVKINDTTIYSGSENHLIDTFDWYDLGISGSASVTDTVTVSLSGSAIHNNYQFNVASPTSQIVTTGSGSSGGDDSGGDDGGGGSNSSLKEYTFTALGVTAKATYTSGPEVTITILSWSGYNSIPYWRITGRYSQGDKNIYLGQNNKSSNSFNSYDGYNDGGKEYTFQVCRNRAWGNDDGENSVFLVDFSLGGSGGSGEGGSSSPVTLYVNQGEGTKIKIIRTWSNNSTHYYGNTDGIMYENGVMFDNQIWYDGDFFEIAVEAENGYELEYYNFDGYMVPFNTDNLEWVTTGEYISDKRYRLVSDSDVTITTTATPSATARIYSNSSWNKYILHIFSNSNWNKYTPYIYKNSSWNRYS